VISGPVPETLLDEDVIVCESIVPSPIVVLDVKVDPPKVLICKAGP
jgi:hypothetical protein